MTNETPEHIEPLNLSVIIINEKTLAYLRAATLLHATCYDQYLTIPLQFAYTVPKAA